MRLQTAAWTAAAAPSAVLALAFSIALAASAPFPVAPPFALLLWASLTAPLVLLAIGVRGVQPLAPAPEPALRDALDAVGRAEALVASQAALVQELAARAPAHAAAPRRATLPIVGAFLLGGLLVGGGVALLGGAMVVPENPVHLHAAFALFDGGERLAFSHVHYDLGTRGFLHAHLHAPDQETLHVEGPPGLTLAEAFVGGLDARFEAGALSLQGPVHQGRVLAPEGVRVWRVLVAEAGGDSWREEMVGLAYVPRDLDRIVIALAARDADLAGQKAAVGTIAASP